jgi:hypothetical protein
MLVVFALVCCSLVAAGGSVEEGISCACKCAVLPLVVYSDKNIPLGYCIKMSDFDSDTDNLLSQVLEAQSDDNDDLKDFKVKSKGKTRFGPLVSDKEIQDVAESAQAKNTVKDTKWALKLFTEWKKARNVEAMKSTGTKSQQEMVPGLTATIPKDKLNYWFCRFVLEIRKRDGSPYPPATLRHILAALQRYLRETHNRSDLSIFDDPEFNQLRKALDGKMKHLSSDGIGLHRKQANCLEVEDEQVMWDKGVFNEGCATGLHNLMYFYTAKIFGLRAADEHRGLKVEQFTFGSDKYGQFVEYKGGVCKTHQGGLKQTGRNSFKCLKQYASPANPRCYVRLLKKYFALIPDKGPFYRRPLPNSQAGQIKFSKQPVGVHHFESLLQKLTKEAGLEGYYTGHSAKVRIIIIMYIYIHNVCGQLGRYRSKYDM